MKKIEESGQFLSLSGFGLGLAFILALTSVRAGDAFTLVTAQTAAKTGDPNAEYFLGKAYEKGNGVARDYAKAAEYFRQAAERGCAPAQNDLGAFYARGLGVKQDYEEAARWYRKAAEQGDPLAEYSLGRIYSIGRGVPQDSEESLRWYRKAAEQNQPDALVSLGDMYMFGANGVSLNNAEAFKYYTNAVAHGRTDCLNSLGLLYEQGLGGQQSVALALKCYREAALKNDGRAQANLGRMYRDGVGVNKDLVEAYRWFVLAERNGSPMARHYLEELQGDNPLVQSKAGQLTPEQIQEAMRRANQPIQP